MSIAIYDTSQKLKTFNAVTWDVLPRHTLLSVGEEVRFTPEFGTTPPLARQVTVIGMCTAALKHLEPAMKVPFVIYSHALTQTGREHDRVEKRAGQLYS